MQTTRNETDIQYHASESAIYERAIKDQVLLITIRQVLLERSPIIRSKNDQHGQDFQPSQIHANDQR
ncbi:hypothetical protein SAMN05421772_103132 [Paracoccus saliphilus]|uniref:Uncharacterized protein n=1 Tax=Paracoccus saliphilus TaxID=405559 RepID=A0AA46A4W2_9RHOB|nr:hypothetical protein SAMN05421772_103132 [Paracoccus saliphilus]